MVSRGPDPFRGKLEGSGPRETGGGGGGWRKAGIDGLYKRVKDGCQLVFLAARALLQAVHMH